MSVEDNKALVRTLVDEGVNQRDPDVLDQVAEGQFAGTARRWVSPFESAFPDFRMEIVDLIAEGDTVVAHFKCSGTHEPYPPAPPHRYGSVSLPRLEGRANPRDRPVLQIEHSVGVAGARA